jgi:hypothetical protein
MSELAEIIAEAQKKDEPKKPQPWWALILIAAVPAAITGFFSLRQTMVESAAAGAKNAAGYEALRDAVQELQSHDVENGKALAGINASVQTLERWVQSLRVNDIQHSELQLKHGTQLGHLTLKASPPAPVLHALLPPKPTIALPNTLNDALAQQKSGVRLENVVTAPAATAPAEGSPAR